MPHPGQTPSRTRLPRIGGRGGRAPLAAAWGLIVLAAAAPAAASGSDPGGLLVLVTHTLWDGWFIPGETTELRIELRSHMDGVAQVTLRSGSLILGTRATLRAERTSALALPLRPPPTGRVEVTAVMPDHTREQIVLTLRPHPDRILPTTAAVAAVTPPAIRVVPADLPRTAEGYGPVGYLRLRPADLLALDTTQAAALEHYLADCGRLSLSGASDSDLMRIRAASGCRGQRVSADAMTPDASDTDASHAEVEDHLLPWLRSLPERDDRRPLALLLLPYGLLLAALMGARRLRAWVLIVPGTAAVLVWLALPFALGANESSTWSDAKSDDPVSRFVTHIETHGQGRAAVPIPLPVGSTLPRALDGGPVVVDIAAAGRTLAGSGPLFQQRRYLVRGVSVATAGRPARPGPRPEPVRSMVPSVRGEP